MSIRYIVAAAFAIVIGYFLFSNPDATFRSSDGHWADSEVQFKGRNFRSVVELFEAYKINCHAPKAVLLRATPQSWFNVFAWPSYLTEKKWRVPYSDTHPELGNYYPPSTESNCANEGWSSSVSDQAPKSAKKYIDAL